LSTPAPTRVAPKEHRLSPKELAALRAKGCKGSTLSQHRALRRFSLTSHHLLSAIGLALGVTAAWVLAIPGVCLLWQWSFEHGLRWLGLPGTVLTRTHPWAERLHIFLPYPSVAAGPVEPGMLLRVTLVVLAVLLGSFFIPKRYIPLIYALRALAAVQASALVYFSLYPPGRSHELPAYTLTLVACELVLISLVPLALGFTYYVFGFHLRQKLGLTLLAMGHLTLLVPLQLLAHTVIIHRSILFMPLLYICFGLVLNVLVFVGFYSWGVSWKTE
jgi:hypothetical protein